MTKYEKDLSDGFELRETEFTTSLYKKMIRNWHEKATGEDYFSRFIFEYLSLAAIIGKYANPTGNGDRGAIEWLKENKDIKQIYLTKIGLELDLTKLIDYLKTKPVENNGHKIWIHDKRDWRRIIEFIYSVRNNLFHGGKDPEDKRDQFLVEQAYKLLRPLVEILLDKIGMGVDH